MFDITCLHLTCTCITGCDPKIMGIGPVPASKAALKAAGKEVKDMDICDVRLCVVFLYGTTNVFKL